MSDDPFNDLNQSDLPVSIHFFKKLEPKLISSLHTEFLQVDQDLNINIEESVPFESALSSIRVKFQVESQKKTNPCKKTPQYDKWVKQVLLDCNQYFLVKVNHEKKIVTKNLISSRLKKRADDLSPCVTPDIHQQIKRKQKFQRNKSSRKTSITPNQKFRKMAYKYQKQNYEISLE